MYFGKGLTARQRRKINTTSLAAWINALAAFAGEKLEAQATQFVKATRLLRRILNR